MRLPELDHLDGVVDAHGICVCVYKTTDSRQLGWVVTAGGEVVAWDGWRSHSDALQVLPLTQVLADGDPDVVRSVNVAQLAAVTAEGALPLMEHGLWGIADRASSSPRGWGANALVANPRFAVARLVAVSCLGDAEALRFLADTADNAIQAATS